MDAMFYTINPIYQRMKKAWVAAVWTNREYIPSPTVIEEMLRFIYNGKVWNLKEVAANLVAGEKSLCGGFEEDM